MPKLRGETPLEPVVALHNVMVRCPPSRRLRRHFRSDDTGRPFVIHRQRGHRARRTMYDSHLSGPGEEHSHGFTELGKERMPLTG